MDGAHAHPPADRTRRRIHTQAPGLKRFAPIAPSIAGGSAPSIEGLDWLKEKGYRTLHRPPQKLGGRSQLRRRGERSRHGLYLSTHHGHPSGPLPSGSIRRSHLPIRKTARSSSATWTAVVRPWPGTSTSASSAMKKRQVGHWPRSEELGLGHRPRSSLPRTYLAVQKPKAKAAMARVAMATARPPAPEVDVPTEAAAPDSGTRRSDPAGTARDSRRLPPKCFDAPPEAPPLARRGAVTVDAPRRASTPGFEHSPGSLPITATRPPGDPWPPWSSPSIGVPLAFWGRTMFNESRYRSSEGGQPFGSGASIARSSGRVGCLIFKRSRAWSAIRASCPSSRDQL